ncbi:SH3 domain-containing protein [Terrarubrum flagellatum]|uniref:SH3 domain-containing protein n=1 Tax=Terrirubrum flagellatum TaxID=2895980 RepID=UPI0031452380
MILLSRAALVALLLTAACATGAQATTFCEIKPTRDGFVALRADPSLDARIVGRMRVGDEIMVHSESRGRWIKATWWKGGRFKVQREAGYDPANGVGWVHQSMLAEDSCG